MTIPEDSCNRLVHETGARPSATASVARLGLLGLVSLLLLAPLVKADDSARKVRISSFAGWKYGSTDENTYLRGTEDGSYENVNFAIALTSAPTDKLRISGQVELHTTDEEDEEVEVELDYIFAAWHFSDRFTGMIGRAKHPFGIYSEVFDVGTIRPFFDLPQSAYGPAGVAGEGYEGVGLRLIQPLKAWDLELDVYAGRLNFEVAEPWAVFDGSDYGIEESELEEAKSRSEVLGMRLTLRPPVPGLNFGISTYSGLAKSEDSLEGSSDEEELRATAFGFHVEYDNNKWQVRSEYVFLDEDQELEHEGFYLEAGYHLTKNWQIAARLDRSDVDIFEVDINEIPSVAKHRDLALGLNYWFNSQFVLKLAVHKVEGNRFAFPEDLGEVDMDLNDETSLIEFGAQFSF